MRSPHLFSRLSLAVGLAALVATAPLAQVEGVGYRIAPSATYVLFDGDAALADGLLYGGGGGLSFGEFLELNGAYLLGDFETDYSGFSGIEEDPELQDMLAALPAREVGVQRYGGDLKLNLSTGAVIPFLRAGAGVVRFSPDERDASRSLYLLGGAGLQFAAADRYTLTVGAEAFAYRYNPGTTFFSPAELGAVGLGIEDFNQVEVVNPAIRAALQLYLGGRRPGELTDLDREFQRQFSGGLSGLSLVVEPFYSRVDFDPSFDYSDQTFVGAEAGFDIGPLVGLRGFYGRGTPSDDPTEFEDIQMFGGDVRLRLSGGTGLVPFLTVGAGYLDVLDGYADVFDDSGEGIDRALAEDRPFAVGGAGIEIPFGPRLRAVGEVRALVMSTQDEGDVSRPDDVFVNPTYRAGLSLGLGGDSGDRVAVVRQSDLEAERARLEAELEAQRMAAEVREAELQLAIDQARMAGDSAAVARLEVQRATPTPVAPGRTAPRPGAALAPGTVGADGVAATLPTPVRTSSGERIVTIPLPETGELYVRYGDLDGGSAVESIYGTEAVPGQAVAPVAAVSEADLREEVRAALREALADQDLTGDALTEDDLDSIQRRIEDQLAARIGDRFRDDDGVTAADLAALERRLELAIAARDARPAPAPVVVTPDGQAVTPDPAVTPATTDPVVAPEAPAELRPRGFYAVSPTTGFAFGRTENVVVGLRAEYASGGSLTYLPELLVSVAGQRSFTLNLDTAFRLPAASLASVGAPYVRVGLGLVNTGASDDVPDTFEDEVDDGGTAVAFNLGLGADVVYGGGRFFVDFSTGNFGRYNRLTAGYRFPFGARAY
ncbi:hypothetical protein [Rubrivirga sp.]|uniref:hypothetical protein n=1 Tax=Rubrivirga sp. TaxID=1885344 RepID=UPI003B5238F3